MLNIFRKSIILFLIFAVHPIAVARETGCQKPIERKLAALSELIEGEKPKEYGVYICKKITLNYYEHNQFFQAAIIYSSDGMYWSEHLVVFFDSARLVKASLVGYIRIGGKAEDMNDAIIDSNGSEIIIHANQGPTFDGDDMRAKKFYAIKDHTLIKVREEKE